ncbi:MAG: DUF4080 domain-containing protein, partial [Planctomycetes bacterium]|nr:DUF4080 domain-containing protein [Planctomycetota bacterium]
MASLLLATLNARFAHSSFGLRYLRANLGELRAESALLELEITTPRDEVVEAVLAHEPAVVGLGVYIWNVRELTGVVADLKRIRPELVIVLGGPEVSHEADEQEICRLADYTVQGEADLAFAALARRLLAGERPPERILAAPLPDLSQVALPYGEYTDDDLARKRVVYVEASRGCPFRCAFCLSSLPDPVRAFETQAFLASMQDLLDRGALNFKFVDRTFNLSARTCVAILEFFRARLRPGLHLHFELIPDRLPQAVRELTRTFPSDTVQFEVGIQTFSPGVNAKVSRRQDDRQAVANLEFLRDQTQVHVHADLLFGLPGETLESFAESFDRLLPLVPGDVQLGILKRIRGTPIRVHESDDLVFSPVAPYELLASKGVTHADLNRVKRLAQAFDRFRNRSELPRTLELLTAERSPFAAWLAFSDWLRARVGRAHSLSDRRRVELLWEYLVEVQGLEPPRVARAIYDDVYVRGQGIVRLDFLDAYLDPEALRALRRRNRQA